MGLTCITGGRECDGCGLCLNQKIICDRCEETITDYYYEIHGRILCKECIDDLYRKEVD